MNGIIPIILGVIIILSNNFLLDYYEKVNIKFGVPVKRKIMFARLMVSAVFLIIIGLIMVLKSGIN